MKKLFFSIVFGSAVFCANALDFSAGIGGSIGYIFLTATDIVLLETDRRKINILKNTRFTPWGFYAFFDVQYIEFNLGFKSVLSKYSGNEPIHESEYNFLNLGFKIKYPFIIDEDVIEIYPLIGLNYSIFVSGRSTDTPDGQVESSGRGVLSSPNLYDIISLNFGAGTDFFVNIGDFYISGDLYIRLQFTYEFQFNTEIEKEMVNSIKSRLPEGKFSMFKSGPIAYLAVGFRFYSSNRLIF
ncbi:MAG: hypothetical protein LBG79_06535 [Spirochaetaceae bacterium]|jgi:hypothetical protein|nr:hypothetical protein [Spirochaetaceae bacterium]